MNLPDEVRAAPRLAVITGAAGGLGAAIAADLDKQGWATIRVDVRSPEADVDAGYAQPTVFLPLDVRDDAGFAQLGESLRMPRDRFLVVAAAGVISVGRAENLSLAEWSRVIEVNLTGTFVTLRSMIAAAREAETGRLIAISSDAGKTGEPWLSHYSASKFGVIGLVQSLALELVGHGVTVNAICPSIVDTPMMDQLARQMADATGEADVQEWRRRFVAEVPAGRACLPNDVTNAVTFFAGEGSQFLTGQSLNVAGGHEMH
ncbi:SDR family NAD(P)-dependent oxidoreductase [Leucobacter luti]|uniref:SDR family NAD(P)-dependent oxidoreductase n=1 Tax=Leucobacter luti TaxID=340320 RepID=UPI003CFE5694